MLSANAIQIQIQVEERLSKRYSAPLGLRPQVELPVIPTGVEAIDQQIGGIPCGAITEICTSPKLTSGASSLLISLLAGASKEHFCALIDCHDTFNARWAEASGVLLERLLWVRCQEQPHRKPYLGRVDQALKATDLILRANCGFGLIVADLGDVAEELARRIHLDVWHRFRFVAQNLKAALVFCTPAPVSGTCSALVLRLAGCEAGWTTTVLDAPTYAVALSGFAGSADVSRIRDKKKNSQDARLHFTSTRKFE